jgi:hypothetical protein
MLLWIALVAAAPVPIGLLGPGWIPPLALVELGAASLGLAALESARGTVLPVAAVLLGQGLLWCALFAVPAALAARALGRRAWLVVALAVALLVAAAVWPVYRTPYHATRYRVGLLEVYR